METTTTLNAAPEASCEKKCVRNSYGKIFHTLFFFTLQKHDRNGTETQTPEKLSEKGVESPFNTLQHPSTPFEINETVTQPQPQKGEKGCGKRVWKRPFSCYTCMMREGEAARLHLTHRPFERNTRFTPFQRFTVSNPYILEMKRNAARQSLYLHDA